MVDHVIVTVIYKTRKFDMEIPANITIEKIMPNLATAFQAKGISTYGPLALTYNGQELKATDTLLQSGVWDGSYLELKDRG